jgi:amino acid adenylation domain-containing protein
MWISEGVVMRYALSPSQQGLWFLSQVDDQISAAYNVVLTLRSNGPIDAGRLQRTLAVLQARHEALRCRVVSELGVPSLEIFDAAHPPAWTLAPRTGDLATIAADEGDLAFAMDVAPLARAILVSAPDGVGQAGVVFVFPHLLFDDGSAKVFLEDLQRVDRALTKGVDPVDLPPAGSLRAMLEQEQHRLSSPRTTALATEVAQRLAGMPDRLALPGGKDVGGSAGRYAGAAVEFQLTAPENERLAAFARAQRSTTVAVCLAAYELLLWRYSGQDDFGVCMPVANRSSEDMQKVVGYLTNLSVVRGRVKPTQTVAQFIGTVTEQLWDVLDACALPFPLLARHIKRLGGDLQGPLLQIGFSHVLADDEPLEIGAAQLYPLLIPPRRVKNQLKLDLSETHDGLRGLLLYDRETLDTQMVQRIADGYRRMLLALTTNASMRVQDLPLLTEAERHQILVQWNDTKADFPQDKCIHQLFEEQVERSPDAMAVVFEDQQLTYAQLNAKANQLAHHLRGLGVKPDTLVAICVERSLEMVIGLLGILKAGGAYVPLDPDYPEERLAFMLQDTDAPVLLTQAHLRERVPRTASQIVCLDSEWSEIGNCAATNPPTVTSPLNLAYCIYTSGSTGRPKGSLNTHRGFVNLSMWYASDRAGHRVAERTLLASSLSFDLTQKNVIGTLMAGGMLVLPNGPTADVEAIATAADRYRPTRLNCSPSALRAFAAAALNDSLRTLVLGGEPIDATLVADCNDKGLTLVNSYGPTECADVAVSHLCEHGAHIDKCPLGRPLPNVQVCLLDAQLQPVPVGVTGELHIAGVGVGRGYLNRPDLTAEKFIPDPFGEPGTRMYRTGDLARYLPDGNIEFLGRIDHQVKIRGFRIELGEVEAALRGCEGVREAVVMAREDEPGDKRLVAYLSGREGTVPTVERLREQLLRSLPEYMVPASWVVMESLPLNPNGKIDRRALPAPQVQAVDTGARYEEPRNEVERRLAEIWVQVLKLPRVGIHDNFFALGGHSLLATQVVGRVAQEGLGQLALRTVFDAPTVERLARMLQELPSQVPSAASPSSIPRLPRADRSH